MEGVNNRVEPSYMASQILNKTHYGIGIYAHVLNFYYPDQTVLSLSGRTCSPTKNPFNADKPTLNIFIQKEKTLNNTLDNEFSWQREQKSNLTEDISNTAEIACHFDAQNAIHAGDAFDFAELHYKQSGVELLQTLNKEMKLKIDEKFDFYKNRNTYAEIQNQRNHTNQTNHSSGIGEFSFSFYKAPIKNIVPHKTATLFQIYNAITGDFYKQRTEKLRSVTDPKQARQYKASTFDYCTFSGEFTARNDKALVRHSGLLCIDFDHLESVDLLRNQLLQDEYFETQLLFVSPSGDGLKWVIPIDTKQATHSDYFAAVANYILQTYGVEVDKSGRDISRACFLPHDPKAFINPILINSHNS